VRPIDYGRVEFHKRNLDAGWDEYRVVLPRPANDTGEFSVQGEPARRAWIKFLLSTAAGVAHACHYHQLEHAIADFWDALATAWEA